VTRQPKPGRRAPKAPVDPWHHLLDLYARLVQSRAPIDSEIAHFLRLRPSLKPEEIGWLLKRAGAMLRRRIRTLQCYRWAGESAPMIGDDWNAVRFAGLEEAAIALYRHLREDESRPPREAREWVVASLSAHAQWTPSPRIRAFEEAGDPLVKLRDFQTRYESDPALTSAPELDQLSAKWSLPADLVERWSARFGTEGAAALAASLAEEPPLDLRVNVHRATRDDVISQLRSAGLEPAPTTLSPHGIRLAARSRVHGLECYRAGLVEMQDEGSQLVALALDPRPGWKVLDACAGAGGKTLHLAAIMKGKGEVHAHDRDERKLEDLRLRARRADANNVRVVAPGTIPLNDYNAVLIDAPCLGLGTIRRNPDIAWRGKLADRMAEMVARQAECLTSYATLVKPGGFLVYTTCSFEPEETTELLAQHLPAGFEPAPLAPGFTHHGVGLDLTPETSTLTLLPSVQGTDGFFVARFVRRS